MGEGPEDERQGWPPSEQHHLSKPEGHAVHCGPPRSQVPGGSLAACKEAKRRLRKQAGGSPKAQMHTARASTRWAAATHEAASHTGRARKDPQSTDEEAKHKGASQPAQVTGAGRGRARCLILYFVFLRQQHPREAKRSPCPALLHPWCCKNCYRFALQINSPLTCIKPGGKNTESETWESFTDLFLQEQMTPVPKNKVYFRLQSPTHLEIQDLPHPDTLCTPVRGLGATGTNCELTAAPSSRHLTAIGT